MNDEGHTAETVLVTGGSGYVAGWVILGLLEAGYAVRATLRSRRHEDRLRELIAGQGGDTARLSFVLADLTSDAGWDEAMAGCAYVQHVASPVGQSQPGEDMIATARDGTLRVLRAAAAHGVRRTVITSSVITTRLPPVRGDARTCVDETVWSDPAEKSLGEYGRSKTAAELAAWDFIAADSSGMTLATVLPAMIIGPVMSGEVHGSVEFLSRLLKGTLPRLPRIGYAVSDVRDLVDIHLRAMVDPAAANQRFIATSDFLWLIEMAHLLREQLGDQAARVPTRELPDFVMRIAALFQADARFIAPNIGKRLEFDVGKADRLLGWRPRPAATTVVDCARSIIAHGAV